MVSPLAPVTPGDIWMVLLPGAYETKERFCVITRVDGTFAELIYGQGKCLGGIKQVIVEPGDVVGRRGHFTKTTYFRETNVVLVDRSVIKPGKKQGHMPPGPLQEFMDIARDASLAGLRVNMRPPPVAGPSSSTPPSPR